LQGQPTGRGRLPQTLVTTRFTLHRNGARIMSVGHHDVAVPLLPGGLSDLRQWARVWLGSHPTGVDSDDVLLAMTEAVTNSVRHGAPPVSVDLTDDARRVRLEVTDGSDVLPCVPSQGRDQLGGRGLVLMEAVTERWGVSLNTSGGKTVWCMFQPVPSKVSPA